MLSKVGADRFALCVVACTWAASMLRGDASYELCDFATLVRLVRVVAWLDLDGLLDEWRREVATCHLCDS